MLHAVVMAGGGGTRFWPVSRQQRPKQLLRIVGRKTMLQESVARLGKEVRPEHTWVFTNRAYVAEVRRQLPSIPAANVVGEPVGRNTAPCIGAACAMIAHHDPQACVLVVTADHSVRPAGRFRRCIRTAAAQAAQTGRVVTFGIRPTYPATGYGYIHTGTALSQGPPRVLRGRSFLEKPQATLARRFFKGGRHLWNSGMFVFTVSTILDLFCELLPEVHRGIERIRTSLGTRRARQAFDTAFRKLPSISIDYGIMNKLADFLVVEADFEWDDVGSWSALERLHPKDDHGNISLGLSELLHSNNCTIVSGTKHLVAAVGLENLIVVHTDDATLVCDKAHEQQVRELVAQMRARKRAKYL